MYLLPSIWFLLTTHRCIIIIVWKEYEYVVESRDFQNVLKVIRRYVVRHNMHAFGNKRFRRFDDTYFIISIRYFPFVVMKIKYYGFF